MQIPDTAVVACVDLGDTTTDVKAFIARDGKKESLTIGLEKNTDEMRTAVLRARDGALRFGRAAVLGSMDGEGALHVRFKGAIGSTESFFKDAPRFPGEHLTPLECFLAIISGKVLPLVRDAAQEEVTHLLVTAPVGWAQPVRKEVYDALRTLVPNVLLVNDPDPILRAYRQKLGPGEIVLTTSIGGLSIDDAAFYQHPLGMRIVANEGNTNAGDELDRRLGNAVAERAGIALASLTDAERVQFLDIVEQLKIHVLDADARRDMARMPWPGHADVTLRRTDCVSMLNALCDEWVLQTTRTKEAAERELRDRYGVQTVCTAILLEGGTTLADIVLDRYTKAFGENIVRRHSKPRFITTSGLYLMAEQNRLTPSNVTNHGVQIVVPGGPCLKAETLIPKNTPIPLQERFTIHFALDGTTNGAFPLTLFQGEGDSLSGKPVLETGMVRPCTVCAAGDAHGIDVSPEFDPSNIVHYDIACTAHGRTVPYDRIPLTPEIVQSHLAAIRDANLGALHIVCIMDATGSMKKAFSKARAIMTDFAEGALKMLGGRGSVRWILYRDHDEKGGCDGYDVAVMPPVRTVEEFASICSDPRFTPGGGGRNEAAECALLAAINLHDALPEGDEMAILLACDTLPHGVHPDDPCSMGVDIDEVTRLLAERRIPVHTIHVFRDWMRVCRNPLEIDAETFYTDLGVRTKGSYTRLEDATDIACFMYEIIRREVQERNPYADVPCLRGQNEETQKRMVMLALRNTM